MTQREFFEAIIKAEFASDKIVDTEAKTLVTIEDVKAFAKERIAHLDTVNSNRKAKGTPTQRENAALMDTMLNGVEFGVQYTASALAEKFGITTAKASALAQKFVANGKAVASDVKIKGKGKVKGYTFTAPETEDIENNGD